MKRIIILAATLCLFSLAACSDKCETITDLKNTYKKAIACQAGDTCVPYVRVGDGCSHDFTPWEACGVIAINGNLDVFTAGVELSSLNEDVKNECVTTQEFCADCIEVQAARAWCDETSGTCQVELLDTCEDDSQCPYGRVCCPDTDTCTLEDICLSYEPPEGGDEDEEQEETVED